jgi:hypothetical protein
MTFYEFISISMFFGLGGLNPWLLDPFDAIWAAII